MVDTISKGAIVQCRLGQSRHRSRALYRYLALRYNDRKVTDPGVNLDRSKLRRGSDMRTNPLLPLSTNYPMKRKHLTTLRAEKINEHGIRVDWTPPRWFVACADGKTRNMSPWQEYCTVEVGMNLSKSQVTQIRSSEHLLVTTPLQNGRVENTIFKFSEGCRTADRVACFQTDHETRDISSVLTSKYILLNENDQKLHIINLTRGVCGQLTRSVDISVTRGEDSIVNCRDQLTVIFVLDRGDQEGPGGSNSSGWAIERTPRKRVAS